MSDILSTRAADPVPPPLLTGHLRDHLLRGHRATLRRHQHAISLCGACHPDAGRHMLAIARLEADIAELEALA